MNILELNDDCLYHVFRFLTFPKDKLHFGEVCARWQNICKSSWKESKMTITFHHDLRSSPNYEILANCDFEKILEIVAPTLNEISLCVPSRKSKLTCVEFFLGTYILRKFQMLQVLQLLSKLCHNVMVVKVDLAVFAINSFAGFLDQNERLEELVIEGNYKYYSYDLDSHDFVKSLKRFTLICCCGKSRNLEPFLKGAKNLEELKIIEGNFITFGLFHALSMHATQLKKLHLEYDEVYEEKDVPRTPEIKIQVLAKLPNLEKLCLKKFRLVLTDEALAEITSSCQKLNLLSISDCEKLTSTGVKFATSHLPKLQYLYLKQLRIKEIIPVTHEESHVKKLRIFKNRRISNDVLCQTIKNMPHLKVLEIDDSFHYEKVIFFIIDTAISRQQNFCLIQQINREEELEIILHKPETSFLHCKKSRFSLCLITMCERNLTKIIENYANKFWPSFIVTVRIVKNDRTENSVF